MNLNSKISLWLINFWKRNSGKILSGIVIIIIIIILNNYLKQQKSPVTLKSTYNPNKAVVTNNSVEGSDSEKIKNLMDRFIKYCNEKNYKEAFELIDNSAKNYLYDNMESEFKKYVDNVFKEKKIYSMQNYSNIENMHIYKVSITEDIAATGTSGQYKPNTEYFTFKRDGKDFKLSNQGYIQNKELKGYNEDENLKVEILSKDVSYKKEGYNLKIFNKTDKYIILADNQVESEITLSFDSEQRAPVNLTNSQIILYPREEIDISLIFNNFIDANRKANLLKFNSVRILNEYDANKNVDTTREANKVYGFSVKIND